MCDLNVMCTWPAGVIAYGSVCKRRVFLYGGKGIWTKLKWQSEARGRKRAPRRLGWTVMLAAEPDGQTPHKHTHRHKKTHYTSQIMLLRHTTCIVSSGLLLALFLSHTLISTCSYPGAHLAYSSAGVNRQIIGLRANLNHWKINLAFMRQLS